MTKARVSLGQQFCIMTRRGELTMRHLGMQDDTSHVDRSRSRRVDQNLVRRSSVPILRGSFPIEGCGIRMPHQQRQALSGIKVARYIIRCCTPEPSTCARCVRRDQCHMRGVHCHHRKSSSLSFVSPSYTSSSCLASSASLNIKSLIFSVLGLKRALDGCGLVFPLSV